MSAWRALDRFDGRSLRAWLYRIATNRCLNHRRDESRRPQPASLLAHGLGCVRADQPSDDPWWLEPYPGRAARTGRGRPRGPLRRPRVHRLVVRRRSPAPARPTALGPRAARRPRLPGGRGGRDPRDDHDVGQQRLDPRPSRVPPGPDPGPRSHGHAQPTKPPWSIASSTRSSAAISTASSNLLSDDARLSMPPEPIQCQGPAAIVEFLQQRRFWGPELTLRADRAPTANRHSSTTCRTRPTTCHERAA